MIPQLNTLFTLCCYALPVWLLLRSGWLLLRKPRRCVKPLREIAMCCFAVFMTGMLCMALEGKWAPPQEMLQSALDRLRTLEKIHLVPFHTVGPQLRALPAITSVTQLLGNILLFAPWGFFLPLLWPRLRRPLTLIGMALLLTCSIEFTQLFINRFVEVDDVMLNFLGSMLGAGGWRCVHRLFPHLDKWLLEAR